MVGIKALSLLAVAGSALAAPQAGFPNGPHIVTVSDITFTTIMVTVTAGVPGETPVPAVPTPAASPVTTSAAAVVVESSAAPAPAPAATSAAPAAAAPASSDSGYMAIVNQYRSAMGLPSLTQDSTLEANALKTCDESGGQLKHELNPGSMAQVLAPGTMDDFEKIYVGGWLCEVPSAVLNCATMSQGWDYEGQTGHADILDSTSYTKIGCAGAEGVVGCDLA